MIMWSLAPYLYLACVRTPLVLYCFFTDGARRILLAAWANEPRVVFCSTVPEVALRWMEVFFQQRGVSTEPWTQLGQGNSTGSILDLQYGARRLYVRSLDYGSTKTAMVIAGSWDVVATCNLELGS